MAVILGAARSDENGRITGGKAGDQKQINTPDIYGEVSRHTWYRHMKGWRVLRCKDPAKAEKIAWDMEAACDNKNIGYDQNQDQTLYNVVKPLGFNCAKVTTPCETDCARLVRVCVLYAGINVEDFYTANEAEKLMRTGAFIELTDKNFTDSEDYLNRGDILVTASKGHSEVVLSNGSMANADDPKSYSQSTSGIYQVKDGCSINMRMGAGTNYAVIEVLPQKTQVGCDGHYTMNGSTKWLYVKHNGIYGYCSTKYLDKKPEIMPPAKYDAAKSSTYQVYGGSLNMRRGAGTGYKVIEVLHSGDKVQNYGYYTMVGSTPWLYVKHGNNVGYCSTKYLKKV